jgi:hypothetical protein
MVAARWAALLEHGGLDAAARPEAAAAVVAAAWLVVRAGNNHNDNDSNANGNGNENNGHERWAATRAAAFTGRWPATIPRCLSNLQPKL